MKNINVYYSPDYLCDGYGVDTREKAGDIAAALQAVDTNLKPLRILWSELHD